MKVYVDLDGVLADFDEGARTLLKTDNPYKWQFVYGDEAFWNAIHAKPDFFASLPLKQDAMALWRYLKPYSPAILTALSRTNTESTDKQKRAWVAQHLGADVQVLTCWTKDKPLFSAPGSVLIDDRNVNADAWQARGGGFFILHTHTWSTIDQFNELMK